MTPPLHPLAALLAALLTAPLAAQTETTLHSIAQSGIGSNGFGTYWRGQDIALNEDAWLTRIVFQTGSATQNVDEIRLMTSGSRPTTLRVTTMINQLSSTEVEGVLPQPYLLRVGVRYTIWFHQSGNPRGTYGCDLTREDPNWRSYHTNLDPTQAPGGTEPRNWWSYQYGTNCRLIGYDNLEITGSTQLGGTATFSLETRPFDFAVLLFASRVTDQPLLNFSGPLRLDLPTIAGASFFGSAGAGGMFVNSLTIPNDPRFVGVVIYTQGLYDPSFATTATFSPLDELRIR